MFHSKANQVTEICNQLRLQSGVPSAADGKQTMLLASGQYQQHSCAEPMVFSTSLQTSKSATNTNAFLVAACECAVKCRNAVQENSLSAFSQWRAAASSPDLPAFLADTSLVRTALLSISKAQATAAQLAKTIADKTEAGSAHLFLL